MSKLGAYRIVNLTYNNDSQNAANKIIDELFELKSEHSLMLLRNGGGKTVQVQMLMAPFVSPRFRDVNSREFKDYFTDDKNPTYIVTEWELENNDKVMIGLAVKKASSTLDEEDNSLEIKSFVYEYRDADDEFGIRNMPFSKKTDKGYTVMNMSEAETLFKNLKNKNKFTFNYYDLNLPNHRGRYYEKLRGYSIEPSEWESVMRNINLAEGGLSDLFKNCKTEAALIEDWILKNIGVKLNREEDIIKEMGKSVKKYVNNKQSKQNLIDIINGINDYKIYSNDIISVNSQLKTALDKLDEKVSQIEDIMIFNHHTYNELVQQETDWEIVVNELKKDMAFNKYEESSFSYHESLSKVEDCKKQLQKEESLLNDLKEEILKLERDLEIQNVISFNNQKTTKEQELNVIKAKIEKELKSNAQVQEQLTNIAYSLQKILKEKQKENLAEIQTYEQIEIETKQKYSELNSKLINLKADEKTLNTDILKFDKVKSKFNEVEKEVTSIIELPLGYSVLDVENIQKELKSEIDKKQASVDSIQEDIETVKNTIVVLKDDKNNKKLEEVKILSNIDKLNLQLQNYEQKCEDIKGILEYLGFNAEDIFNNEENLLKLKNIIDSVLVKNDTDINNKNKKMSELDMLKKGIIVEIPKDVKNKFSELEIEYELGLNYLNKLKISDNQKLELLERNPFLPFSIILDGHDIATLKNSSLDIASSYNIYILDRDEINCKIDLEKTNSVYSLSNLNILLNFNNALLSEDVKNEVVKNIETEISSLNTAINENRKYLSKLEKCYNEISNFDITKSMIDSLKISIQKELELLENIKENLKEIDNEIRDIEENKIPSKNVELNKIKTDISKVDTHYNLVSEFILEFNNYEDKFKEITLSKEKLCEIKNEISNTEKEIVLLEQQKAVNDAKYRTSKDIAEEIKSKLNEINALNLDFNNAIILNDEFEDLEASFKALKSKSSLSLEELEEKQESLTKEINMLNAEINSLIELNSIQDEEYKEHQYLIEIKEKIKKSLAVKKKEVNEQQKIVEKLNILLGETTSKAKIALELCEKSYKNLVKTVEMYGFDNNYTGPFIEKDNIECKDFKKQYITLKDELSAAQEEISNVKDNMSYIKSSVQKLDFLSDIQARININERKSDLRLSSISEIEDYTTGTIKEYKAIEKEIELVKQNVDDVLTKLTTEFKYRDIGPFSKNIQGLLEVRYDPDTVSTTIESALKALDTLEKKHEADLKIVNEEREEISKTLLKYVEQVYIHMSTIDRNSRINIEGENKKMLEIRQPEWDIVLYSTKIEEFLENTVQMCETRIRHNEPIDEYITTQITTVKLYDAVVGIKNVNIILRKLEALNNRIGTSRVKWANVVKNSGGEGFVSAFVILVSLLSYMRKDVESIADKKEDAKVLIMDNPFGKMSSEHLIKPVMTIAEKYNTQLICFTAQKGENIYNRFPNVYHMETEFIASAKVNVLTATRENQKNETRLNGSRFVIEGEQQTMDDFIIE